MRKAFDANVPKLKPRLRPAMVVVSDTTPEKKDEDTNITSQKAINETANDTQVIVLNPETANTSELESTMNDSLTGAIDDDTQAEVGSEFQKNEQNPEVHPDFDRNIVPFPNTSMRKNDLAEIDEEMPDQNRQQDLEPTPDLQIIDSVIAETAQMTVTAQRDQSTVDTGNAVIEILSDTQHAASVPTTVSPAEPILAINDSEERRKRLENIKRRVSDAVRPEVHIEPVPEDPTLAVESVLGLVSDLEAQLSRSREVEKTLRNELAEAKAELTHTVNDGRTASGRLMQVETQLDEKRKVLEEMLFEMGALEEERDQAVRMVQMLTIKDRDRQLELDKLRQQVAEIQRVVDENRIEEERLASELDEYATENTRMHTLLTEVTKERDVLVCKVEQLTRERDDLTDAKKALEKVHHALSQARARLRE